MRIFICNQNDNENRELEELIRSYLTDGQKYEVECLESGEKLLFELSDDPNDADVIICDTRFDGKMDGIDALKQLREIGYDGEIILLSAEEERVFESFDVRPANFLVKKKITEDKTIHAVLTALDIAGRRKREVITLACAGEIRNIPVDDILYFESAQKIMEVHYGDEVFEFYSPMRKLENQMYGRGFVRTHRSFLVNEAHIKSVKDGEVVLDNGQSVPLNTKYKKDLKKDDPVTKKDEPAVENEESVASEFAENEDA